MTDKTLKDHIRKYADLKTQVDTLNALLDAEKKTITEEMTSREIDSFTTAKYAVKLAEFFATRLNTKALKAKAPKLYELYADTVKQTRFTVKAI